MEINSAILERGEDDEHLKRKASANAQVLRYMSEI